LKEFETRFDLEPPVVPVVVQPDLPESERTFERQQRVAAIVVKILVASILAVAIMLYLTRGRQPDQSTAPRVDPGKRTSRRVAFRPSAIIPPQA
jgi:hypothetical protein